MNTIQKIILLLNAREISAAKMMKELGFSSGLFSQWKSGKQKPSAEKICKIAEYLNVSTDYLLDFDQIEDKRFNAHNLFKILEEKELSAKKLSDDTGISTGNISDWKSGRCMPSINALITIADYLNISIDYMVGRTDDPILHKKSEKQD